MKSAYTVIEQNRFRTLLAFSIYFVIFGVIAWFLYYFTKDFYLPLFVFGYAFFYSLLSIFRGDSLILFLTKAKEIKKDDNPELYRLVENLAITAGLPKTPKIYLLPFEDMNAFALTSLKGEYKVAFTEGILKGLERKELEGVIGHEISHLKNGDTKVMMIAGLLSSALVIIFDLIFRYGLSSVFKDNNRKSSGFLGLIFIILILLSPIFALILQAVISQKREYLADASSALLTRNPLALASALEKVSASSQKNLSQFYTVRSLFFCDPQAKLKQTLTSLFSTHPPVEKRIKLLKEMVV